MNMLYLAGCRVPHTSILMCGHRPTNDRNLHLSRPLCLPTTEGMTQPLIMNDTGNLMRTSTPPISVTLLCIALWAAGKPTSSSWQLGPFTRPTHAPVITPNKTSLFTDPIAKAPIHWESLHTFNPAAIVRDNKIYVLYRAEDDTGKMQIGEHTSRLGLATSIDGITFTRLPEPVFYPAKDDQRSRECPGGVEDPRVVESEDGNQDQRYVLTYAQWNRIT